MPSVSGKKSYPKSLLLDNSEKNYLIKKDAFTGVKQLKIIVPSKWLANLVNNSFLKEYDVEVRYNVIDKTVFKPTPSTFKKEYGIEDKIMLLGVASDWSKRKGLDDFIQLANMLDERFAIVLVGLTSKQQRIVGGKVISIQKTNSKQKLAEIYSSADCFINPSREETYGLTTAEAESCGTDVIVYKDTACEEIVERNRSIAVKQGVQYIYEEILKRYGSMGGRADL